MAELRFSAAGRYARQLAAAALLALSLLPGRLWSQDDKTDISSAAATIDRLLAEHWQRRGVQPARPADDATFLRRLTLDLAGRIPTEGEVDDFLADKAADKRQRAIDRLLAGPEFAVHFARVLDELIQDVHAGDEAFVDYLTRSLRQRKPWDALFRELLVGPWDSDLTKPANRFLDRRAANADVLTVDAVRVFFGVDISCAQCHDHPLVSDWSQDHYYGMKSFFHRTTGGKGVVGEKPEGDVTFLASGEEKTAQAMFLTGRTVDELSPGVDSAATGGRDRPASRVSRRAQLVEIALAERDFLSRAIVNRLWEHYFGRGLVSPVDQMHSENPPAAPELLAWLADDFAATGYDLQRLVGALVSSRAYQLSSQWEHDGPLPAADLFAAARLRPLGSRQLAVSLLLATGSVRFAPPSESERRLERVTGVEGLSRIQERLALDKQADPLARRFDPRVSEFQSSAREALFVSNAPHVQQLFAAGEGTLVARLAAQQDSEQVVRAAVRVVLSRPADDHELPELIAWFDAHGGDRTQACQQLVWALASSAEFRFNH